MPTFFPILSGKYTDFTVEWYNNVGVTVMLTMFVNIFTPHIGGIIAYLKNGFFRCLDRNCRKDMRKTKQVMQEEYEALYLGPEFMIEIRYS